MATVCRTIYVIRPPSYPDVSLSTRNWEANHNLPIERRSLFSL